VGGDLTGGKAFSASEVPHNLDNRLGFAGYVWDPWIKMYHVRHRVYDPWSQRWQQPDPIGWAGGDVDFYRYASGDPLNFVDPMGLCSVGDLKRELKWALDGLASPSLALHIADRVAGPNAVDDALISTGTRALGASRMCGALAGGLASGGLGATVAADQAQAGLMQLLTGEESRSLLGMGVEKAAAAAGADPDTARTIADGADMATGAVGTNAGREVGRRLANAGDEATAAARIAENVADDAAGGAAKATSGADDAGSAASKGGAASGTNKSAPTGVPEDALVTQPGAIPSKRFTNKDGVPKSIRNKTNQEVVDGLRNGTIDPKDLPIDYVCHDNGMSTIVNNRSAAALTEAGIPRSSWHGVDRTGNADVWRRMQEQFRRNDSGPYGIPYRSNY
jgi:RHS repeat-associated protein